MRGRSSALPFGVPWEVRLGSPLAPAAWGGLVAAALVLGAVGFRWLFLRSGVAEVRIGIEFATRAALVASLTTGYTLAAWRWNAVATSRELRRAGLAESGADPDPRDPRIHEVSRATLWKSRWAGAAGVLFFALTIEIPNALAGGRPGSTWLRFHAMTYMLGLGVLFFWVAGRLAFFSIGSSATAVPDRLQVDLLDLRPAIALGRIGLRRSLSWVIGFSLASLVFLNPELRLAESLIVFLPILATTVAIAVLALFLPLRGLRRRIAAAKRAELERIRAAIRGDRSALAQSRIAAQAANLGLGDLIAYQRLIESVPAWPIPALLPRLALYLVIPLGSWLGGALVERALASVLD